MHEDATVVLTRDGWMKRVGEIKDPSATRVREGDSARWILRGNTRDNLVLFSNFGVAYVMKVANVPATTGYGEPVQSLLNFKDGERVIAAATAADARPRRRRTPQPARERWLVATAQGMGFFCRPDLSETTRSGRRFARTKDDDELTVVVPADGDTITAITAAGNLLAFPADELPELSGVGRGVILMRLDADDRLVGALCHPVDTPPVAIADDGTERRLNRPELAHRAQKGRKTLKRFKPVELVPRSAAATDPGERDA